jgi:diguanylate cyclase (GGDEF)-like protein
MRTTGLPRTAQVLILVVLAGQVIGFADTRTRSAVLGLSLLILDLIGTVYCVRAARRSTNPVPWRLAGASRALSLAATVCFAVNAVTGGVAWKWVAVSCGLAMFGCLTGTALSVSALRLRRADRWAFVIEVLIILSSSFMIIWYFVIDKALSTADGVELIYELGYPLGNLVALAAVTAVVLRGAVTQLTPPLTTLVAGILLYTIADVAFTAIRLRGDTGAGSPAANAALVIATLLMAVAAMSVPAGRSPARDAAHRAQMPAWSAHLPYVAVGIGNALLLVVTLGGFRVQHWSGLILAETTMTIALAVRQIISLRESRQLNITDPLTGLANLTGLKNAVDRALQRRARPALMLLDLDGFKQVNDRYGHDVGDRILVEFARLVRGAIRREDTSARVGGDEFIVLLDDMPDEGKAVLVAERILAALAANPVTAAGDEITIRSSIGLATARPDDTAEDLKRRADLAMYESKRSGHHSWRLYDPSMTDRRTRDATLADGLLHALGTDQLRVVHQPLVALDTHRPVAVEALLRWTHPELGPIAPAEFIPVAEHAGLIHPIGMAVLRETCAQVQRWRAEIPGVARLHASVNVSALQLREPTFLADVLGTLRETGLPADALILEITESAIVDEDIAIPTLEEMRTHGIRIAVDDFGTGYSSLHQLTRLPVDVLKIDRSFVAELDGTRRGAAVAEAVIRLSQVLGMYSVAEGVETAKQAAELQMLGCQVAQGHLFAQPMPAAEFADYARRSAVAVAER